ncbi:hypothetical protein ACHQM5_006793 [Ranunculus cassubicifolius]
MAVDTAAAVNVTTANDMICSGEPDALSDNICLNDIVSFSSNGARMQEPGNAAEVLTRVELDVAYCSEKLLNLEVLLMQVSARENGIELLAVESYNFSEESTEKGLEFDLLSGILDSELNELSYFMVSLQTEITDALQKIASREHFREAFIEIEEKLRDSEETLKQSLNQLGELKLQFAEFQRTLSTFNGQENGTNKEEGSSGNGHFSRMDTRLKMQTVEQQKHILRMLEKSLARELDMERKLYDSRNTEEELRKKLHSSEQDLYWMEEETEVMSGRLFEAEIASELLMGISKGLMSHLQILQFNLNGSIQREGDMRSKLQNSMDQIETKDSLLSELKISSSGLSTSLKEAENKYILSDSEASILREKLHSLEEQLKDSETKLQSAYVSIKESQEKQNALSSKLSDYENLKDEPRGNISTAECIRDNLTSECTVLPETIMELNEKLDSLRSSVNSLGYMNSLERMLREYSLQLQHAKASAEAHQEKQSLLNSTIDDMDNVIEDLKTRVSKAEIRAEKAEARCSSLSETNMETNEELSYLRSRMECLELSLIQADDEKVVTAKDISIRTKAISDLVQRLSMERERLQNQISSLIKRNNILATKSRENGTQTTNHMSEDDPSTCASVTESSISGFQVSNLSKGAATEGEVKRVVSSVESVRSIDAWQLNSKYYLIPLLVLFVSVFVYLWNLEQCPF